MDIKQINSLISGGESSTLEFKTSTAALRRVAETLCAFLNSQGGTVIIGINDRHVAVGQQVSDRTRQEIANVLRRLEPVANIKVDYIRLKKYDKQLIVLTAYPDKNTAPYTFDGRAYERKESTTQIMPQSCYQQLLLKRVQQPHHWELSVAKGVTVEDLDHTAIIQTIEESIRVGRMKASIKTADPELALKRLKLLINGRLINAAAILFCQDPLPYYPQCVLKMARFRGSTKGEFLDSKQVYGNAFKLLEEAEQFVERHLEISSRFVGSQMQRIDEPSYAPKAVREAVVNAICHRDYAVVGGSINLMIYADRFEIASHGRLPYGITIDDLKHSHESLPRNERVTLVLYRRGLFESVGMGTQDMLKECRELNLPEPEFVERGLSFVVCFKGRPVRKIAEKISERQRLILDKLQMKGSMNVADILEQLSTSIGERTLRRDLNYLESLNLVHRIGKGPKTKWSLR